MNVSFSRSLASSRSAGLLPLGLLLVTFGIGVRVAPAQVPTAAPVVLTLTANDAVRAEARPGWPLLLRADLMHRDAYAASVVPVVVAGWAGALQLEVRDAQGTAVAWNLHPAARPAGDLTIDAATTASLGWWLTPDETASLAPGTYTIRAVLDSTALGGSVPAVRSTPVALTVRADADTPDDAVRRSLLLADFHVLRGQEAEALAAIDALLAGDPDHPAGLAYRADLLLSSGQALAAAQAFDRAAAAYHALNPGAPEPFAGVDFGRDAAHRAYEEATSFVVSVVEKAPGHPSYGRGATHAFAIDGTPGEELVLDRGRTYTFRMDGVDAAHAFYLSTSPEGAGAGSYTAGVEGAPAAGAEVLRFTPGPDAPDVLYYQCTRHPHMGWRLRVASPSGTGVGVEPEVPVAGGEVELSPPYPNPFSDHTRLVLVAARSQQVAVIVYDVLGRRVYEASPAYVSAGALHEVRLDATGWASGLYLVSVEGETFRTEQRVLLVR